MPDPWRQHRRGRGPPAAHRQLRRFRPAGRRAGRDRALCPIARRNWAGRTPSSCPAPKALSPTWPGCERRGWPTRSADWPDGGPRRRHLRRLPDARPRPSAIRRACRVGGDRGGGPGPAAGRDDVRAEQGHVSGAGARAAAGRAGWATAAELEAEGYEIHMGRSSGGRPWLEITRRNGEAAERGRGGRQRRRADVGLLSARPVRQRRLSPGLAGEPASAQGGRSRQRDGRQMPLRRIHWSAWPTPSRRRWT